jgi:hypothetical protein
MIARRQFIKLLGGAAGCPLAASGQQAGSKRAASGLGSANCYRDLEAKCEAALE